MVGSGLGYAVHDGTVLTDVRDLFGLDRINANFSTIDYRLHNPAFAWHLIISLRDPGKVVTAAMSGVRAAPLRPAKCTALSRTKLTWCQPWN